MNSRHPRPARPGMRSTARRPLLLIPPGDPRRARPKPLGLTNFGGPVEMIGLNVADARYHLEVLGLTGVGKSWWMTQYVIAEALAGRGVVLIDCQGDLVRNVLDRLPRSCADRLVVLDPDDLLEGGAIPAFNPLAPDPAIPGGGGEWAAEHLTGTLRQLYASSWGDRMDDLMRCTALTLTHRPDSTLPDVVRMLTDTPFRANLLATVALPDWLASFWDDYDELTAAQRGSLYAPLVSRLRGVLSRRFARALLGSPVTTFSLTEILDGGILLARLPKGELGEDASRLISGLLLAGCWGHTTRRSRRAEEDRPDATVIVDEAQNTLNLPIGVDLALAESRGYRVSWMIAHQHDAQLDASVREAIDANCRNKIYFLLSARDAPRKANHVGPYLTEHDLSARGGFQMVARVVHDGHEQPPFTLNSPPLCDPIPGRAEWLRARARARTGVTDAERSDKHDRREDSRRTSHSVLHEDSAEPAAPPADAGGRTPGKASPASDSGARAVKGRSGRVGERPERRTPPNRRRRRP